MTLLGKHRPTAEEIDHAMDVSYGSGWNTAIDAAVGAFVRAPLTAFRSTEARNAILKEIMDLRHEKEQTHGQG